MPDLKIAVVRLDKIGDLILTTPAIASLKATFPQASLTAIVSKKNKAVLEHSPHIDKLWVWSWSNENLDNLRKEKFDIIMVFSPTTESYKLAFYSRAKIRAGYLYASRILTRLLSPLWLNKRLICQFDQKSVKPNMPEIPHEVEQNLELIKLIAGNAAILETKLLVSIPEKEKIWAAQQLQGGKWIAVHLTRAWADELPTDFITHVLESLAKHHNVFATYGPDETTLVSSLPIPKNVRVFGNPSFHQWAALLERAAVCVSTNTGAVHLAASQKTPVVAVFEPKFFAYHVKRWCPWQVQHAILRKDDPDLLSNLIKEIGNLSRGHENISSDLQQ